MQVYLVMREEEMPAADSLFLRDGFSGPAFLLAPFWLLYHTLWLPTLAYVLALAAIALLNVGMGGFLVLLLALHGFFGMEGPAMRAADLARRGYRLREVVTADTLDDAELRYFTDMAPAPAGAVSARAAPVKPTPPPMPWGTPAGGGRP